AEQNLRGLSKPTSTTRHPPRRPAPRPSKAPPNHSVMLTTFLSSRAYAVNGKSLVPDRSFVWFPGNDIRQAADQVIRLDPLGLGVEVGKDAMAEHRAGDGADILTRDVITAVQDGPGFGAQDQ